jgi:hypothetical protein
LARRQQSGPCRHSEPDNCCADYCFSWQHDCRQFGANARRTLPSPARVRETRRFDKCHAGASGFGGLRSWKVSISPLALRRSAYYQHRRLCLPHLPACAARYTVLFLGQRALSPMVANLFAGGEDIMIRAYRYTEKGVDAARNKPRLVEAAKRAFAVKGAAASGGSRPGRDQASRSRRRLMSARRAVRDAKKAADPEAEATAHRAVDEVKQAPGERGPVGRQFAGSQPAHGEEHALCRLVCETSSLRSWGQ